MNKMQVTYQIRPQESLFFIDQFANGELDKSYGPFWSQEAAKALINRWEETEKVV
jgi:hypothetical protein